MAQEFYIDENGNKIPISGTVTSADMLPIEAGSSKMTSEAIGDLSTLTTTEKSSLVGAVNEVNLGKVDKSSFTRKSYVSSSPFSVNANSIDTRNIAVNDAVFGLVIGFAITSSSDVVMMQCFFNGLSEIQVRVRNTSNNAVTYNLMIFYI